MGQVRFSSTGPKYAYGQLKLCHELSKHRNFAIVVGKASGIYHFKTRFYGPTVMPKEFQRNMDTIFMNQRNVFVFIVDVLFVTKGT